MVRNHCAECPGIAVRFTPESLCGMPQILHEIQKDREKEKFQLSINNKSEHVLLEKAIHSTFFQNQKVLISNKNYKKYLNFELWINRPEGLKPKQILFLRSLKNIFCPRYNTNWEIVQNNKAYISSREYVFSYYLYKKESNYRFWGINFDLFISSYLN